MIIVTWLKESPYWLCLTPRRAASLLQKAPRKLTMPDLVQRRRECTLLLMCLSFWNFSLRNYHKLGDVNSLSHSFCGSRVQVQVSWTLGSESHQTEVKASARETILILGSGFSSGLMWLASELIFLGWYN